MADYQERYTAADIFEKLHIQYAKNKKNVKVICPSCGKKDFYMDMERSFGHCYRASCGFKANQISYYAKTMGLTNREANQDMLAYMGYNVSKTKDFDAPKPRKPKVVKFDDIGEATDIEVRNSVYQELLSILTLKDDHVSALHKRGLLNEEIEKLRYRSFDIPSGKSIANALLSKGYTLEGVPGFYQYQDVWMFRESRTLEYKKDSLKRGILIPFLDVHKQIQGFQIRKDDNLLSVIDGKKEKKCNWLSGNGLKNGCKCNGYVHYAADFYRDFATGEKWPIIENHTVGLTEGPMKGDIIHILTGECILAVPGVHMLDEFQKQIPILKNLGVKNIRIYYDMDYFTNPNVQTSLQNLINIIVSNDFKGTWVKWNTEVENHKPLKGRDDYLMYHVRGI